MQTNDIGIGELCRANPSKRHNWHLVKSTAIHFWRNSPNGNSCSPLTSVPKIIVTRVVTPAECHSGNNNNNSNNNNNNNGNNILTGTHQKWRNCSHWPRLIFDGAVQSFTAVCTLHFAKFSAISLPELPLFKTLKKNCESFSHFT